MNKLITTPAPEKISDAELYSLIKDTNVLFTVEEKIHFHTDQDIWPVVSERAAVLLIRSMFADPGWQPLLSTERVRRLLHSLKSDPDLQKREDDFVHHDLLRFPKGVWSISRGKCVTYDNTLLFSRMVNADVTQDLPAESPAFHNFCKRVFSSEKLEQKKMALYEIIGYCISDLANIKKAIFLIGPANCGKSVILRFIQRLVGDENVSNVSLHNFAHRFSVIEMYDKALNISGEVPSGVLSSTSFDVFKAITGGDRVNLERKGQQPFYGVVNAKLLFAGNMLPTFAKVDGTDSLVERLHILIFDKSVDEDEIDKGMEEKLWAERDGIVRYALEQLKYFVIGNKTFTKLDDEKKLLEEVARISNPILHFLESCIEYDDEYSVHISDVYEAYNEFAASEALPDINRTAFRNLMANQTGIKIGKTKRRLGKNSPRACFEGIRLKKLLIDVGQDTKTSDDEGGIVNE